MGSLADYIEGHIKLLISAAGADSGLGRPVEIQRRELAERFRCAPSQITYVLSTRFTPARGYIVESRRGGGGHIRIWKLGLDYHAEVLGEVSARLEAGSDAATASELIARLVDAGVMSQRDGDAALAAVGADEDLDGEGGDLVRARALRAVIRFLLMQGQAHRKER